MKETLNLFIEKKQDFLSFLKTRFNVFHESNVFFRDLHYGIMAFLKMNGLPSHYSPSEELTRQVIAAYESSKILLRIDERTWMLNYAPFKKTTIKPVPVAKPVAKPAQSAPPTVPRALPQTVAAKPAGIQGEVVG